MKARVATADELALLLDWAAAEGWNPGLDDATAFHAADPEGFFVAEVDGAPVAAISIVNHSAEQSFLGLYLCRPDHRGRGIGYALWQHALSHSGERTIGLDGVPAQEANYARSGFVKTGSSLRHLCSPSGTASLREAAPDDLAACIARDTAITGHARPAFAAAWFAPAPTRRTLLDGEGGQVTIRLCREDAKIGPLYAGSAEQAAALVAGAAHHVGAARVYVDLPETTPQAAQLANMLDAQETFRTARMYRGTPPSPDTTRQFGIATMELG